MITSAKRIWLPIAASSLLVSLAGCFGNRMIEVDSDASGKHVGGLSSISKTCERAINFQASKVSIGAIEIPFSSAGDKVIKIGSVNVDPQSLREASEVIAMLDDEQFTICQQALGLKSEENKMKLFEQSNKNRHLLRTLAISLRDAKTPEQYTAATAVAQKAIDASNSQK